MAALGVAVGCQWQRGVSEGRKNADNHRYALLGEAVSAPTASLVYINVTVAEGGGLGGRELWAVVSEVLEEQVEWDRDDNAYRPVLGSLVFQ